MEETKKPIKIDLVSFFDPSLAKMKRIDGDPAASRYSQVALLWRMARLSAGRDVDPEVDKEVNEIDKTSKADTLKGLLYENGFSTTYKFLSITLYLMLLDQVSQIFPGDNPKTNGIVRLLKSGGLSSKEASAINALRNTLAHNFSLGSANTYKGGVVPAFKFTINDCENPKRKGKPIEVAIKKFDGKYDISNIEKAKIDEMTTNIYTTSLIDYIESVISTLLASEKASDYSGMIKDMDELRTRFTTTTEV